MLLQTTGDYLLSGVFLFIICFAVLFLTYYFTSPIYTEYGDKRSRLLYSIVNALYFALILAILIVVLPPVSNTYGILASIAVAIVVIIAGTIAQIYGIARLMKSGQLKMKQKRRIK